LRHANDLGILGQLFDLEQSIIVQAEMFAPMMPRIANQAAPDVAILGSFGIETLDNLSAHPLRKSIHKGLYVAVEAPSLHEFASLRLLIGLGLVKRRVTLAG